jgi:pyruvate dehydrogenase E2 component (dihydrolipoamide acetyltransferase)
VHDVFVPVLGMAPDDVILTSWMQQPGDPVEAGAVVAVVETSKTELEIESAAAGTMGEQLFPAGSMVAPGTTITHILEPGDAAPPARHTISPRARRLVAESAASDLATPPPTPAAPPPPAVPLSPRGAPAGSTNRAAHTREAIARTVVRSWSEIPHFTVSRELRVGELVATVSHWRAVLPKLTITDLLLRAVALALVDCAGRTDLDVGLAVATDNGVLLPVIRHVPELSLVDLVAARVAAVDRARAGRMHADDACIPVTTLSNLGALGVDQFTGVIPYGSTNLVTVGRAAPRPVVVDGTVQVATTMWTTVNLDHRTWDGAHGATMLERLATIVDTPALFLGGGAPLAPSNGQEAT